MRKDDWGAFFADALGPLDPDASERAKTMRANDMQAVRAAFKAERANARATGIDPDSIRVGYETLTHVINHGGPGTDGKWRPARNRGRGNEARAWNVAVGGRGEGALQAALAEIGLDRASQQRAELGAEFAAAAMSAPDGVDAVDGASVLADMLG
jgi:hypothetical protein